MGRREERVEIEGARQRYRLSIRRISGNKKLQDKVKFSILLSL